MLGRIKEDPHWVLSRAPGLPHTQDHELNETSFINRLFSSI